jgi:hypothetical protein
MTTGKRREDWLYMALDRYQRELTAIMEEALSAAYDAGVGDTGNVHLTAVGVTATGETKHAPDPLLEGQPVAPAAVSEDADAATKGDV